MNLGGGRIPAFHCNKLTAAFHEARALPIGPERNRKRVLARGLSELARTEAWLEGQRSQTRRALDGARGPVNLGGGCTL